ncbi:zinc ribbon domain-containing protein [Massilia sp. YIM B02443]|uniref:zinc ribbon domain-containing protein n=1 Tax=Massilia sp. YIM B02443 TaxID=3050127 RepID=UPI002803E313|nr:zinc ribbon domain-containing protein [Massilia sp. YIM B02443]
MAVRHWTCPGCGLLHDRDVNAAINLKNMAVSFTRSVRPCRPVEEKALALQQCKVKPAPAKQESNRKANSG